PASQPTSSTVKGSSSPRSVSSSPSRSTDGPAGTASATERLSAERRERLLACPFEAGQAALDHRVACRQRDPEPAGDLAPRARQDQDVLFREEVAERLVVFDRAARHHVERSFWHRRLEAEVTEGRDEAIPPTLQCRDVDRQVL